MRKTLTTLFTILLLVAMAGTLSAQEERETYRIIIGRADILPPQGAQYAPAPGERRFIVQLYEIPDHQTRTELRDAGLTLERYIGGRAYLASRVEGIPHAPLPGKLIRAAIAYAPGMKISRLFESDARLSRRVALGLPLALEIRFHEGVDYARAKEILLALGALPGSESFDYSSGFKAELPAGEIDRLASFDEVDRIDPAAPPNKVHNAIAASRSRVDAVAKNKDYMAPTGSGVNVGVWDAGQVGRHTDFGNRVTNVETDEAVHEHSTHVAGTIGGAGVLDGNAKGMAFQADLFSFNFQGDPLAEMARAVDRQQIRISNNSYGTPEGWDSDEDDEGEIYYRYWGTQLFGYYHVKAFATDKLIRDRDYIGIWSAGNERNDCYLGPHKHGDDEDTDYQDLHPPDPLYGGITTFANSKNALIVGATMRDDAMTGFSSWGPAAGGRLKPDVVANGYELYSTTPDDTYSTMSGTSMAAPVVTGVAALLVDQHYRQTRQAISSALLKALIIHSARDLGRTGPDFAFGHGIVDAELAAKVLGGQVESTASAGEPAKRKPGVTDVKSLIIESSIDHRKRLVYEFEVPEKSDELRVTIVWHDPPGELLVNDLDIWVKGPQRAKAKPLTPDPSAPTNPAVERANHNDNVERVFYKNPPAGTWKIYVKGYQVALGPQPFALVISAGAGNTAPVIKSTGEIYFQQAFTSSSGDWSNVEPKSSFGVGDDFYCYAYVQIISNADYGAFYGTLAAEWIIRDSGGDPIFRIYSASNEFPPNDPGRLWRWRLMKMEIPRDMSGGDYTLEVSLTLANGVSATRTYNFSVL